MQFSSETKKAILAGILASLATLFVVAGVAWANRGAIFQRFGEQYAKDLENPNTTSTSTSGALAGQQSLVIGAVKKANPAVVSIVITKDVPKYETYYDNTDPFGGLFGQGGGFGNLFQIPQQRQNGTEKQEVGGGSGFLITKDGMIVTNRHVVDDPAAEYTVFTNDGKKHTAKVIARDSVLDIAILKIDGTGYPYLNLGDSDSIELGQSVVAIGNALGEFRNSVSVGVVSGLSRSITAGDGAGQSEALDHVIQTDAAINPGNSGGPLLDLSGKVVGVNVAVAQGSENIGFSLPINSVKTVIDSVKKTGKIVRPYLGLRFVQVTPELKDKNNLSVDYGALVKSGTDASLLAVVPGGPADKAGIVENDIILEIDGTKLDGDKNLTLLIREKNVGDKVTLKVLHRGEEKTVTVTLQAAPQS